MNLSLAGDTEGNEDECGNELDYYASGSDGEDRDDDDANEVSAAAAREDNSDY
jgi:hypothetical protein